ncbi:protein kinase domain-containing protein [Nocardioides immobilis]|uniref:protein kinase domain-containing protein n=1 Tax=Nocardioides immobilis TaxID=2049295 RepID=UPI0015FDDF5A|nr:protein kinase [Nocardioides immobilis]
MGERFGDYSVIRRLGGGGFGTVYLAESRDGVTVAVKVLNDHRDPTARELFRRELEAAQRVDTRHVAQVHDFDLDADPPWIAFRAVGTLTLKEAARSHETSERALLLALMGAARGLAAMHRAGLTHRDISPDNILVTPTDGVLIDLGLATLGTNTPYSQMLAGKMAYLAPEQWTSSAVTPASDIWQWGVTATKALSGHLPFPPARTPQEQQRLAAEQAPDLFGVGVAADVVAACLRKDPLLRPTAGELVETLRGLLRSPELTGRRLSRRRHTDMLDREAVTEVTRLDVSADGKLYVGAWVPEIERSRGVVSYWRTNAGDVNIRLGDRVAIGWDDRDRVHVGAVLTSLRTGAERSPKLPTNCSSCGTRLEPGYNDGRFCSNEEFCSSLVLPRIKQHLGLARFMRHEQTDFTRSDAVHAVTSRLLERGLFRNEGDLYAQDRSSVAKAVSSMRSPAPDWFLDDWTLSQNRPFVATVATMTPTDSWEAKKLVKALPTLDLLLGASEQQLLEALTPRLQYWSDEECQDERSANQRKAARLRAWLDVDWHVRVLRGMEAAGVPMRHNSGDTWPPRRPRQEPPSLSP